MGPRAKESFLDLTNDRKPFESDFFQIVRKDRADISRRVAGEDWSDKVTALRRIVEG